jgi:peptidoglycan/LPS O-acetylase OafA/YrhL
LGLIALALYYVSWPAGLLQPLAEPQGLFIPSGTLGILLFLLLAQWSAGSRPSQPVAVVGVYSMVVYVQHVVVGAGMRALLMKAHVANAPALILLVLGASLALPVVWQKTTDFLGVTRIFGIRPIANPGWPLAIRAPEES